MPRIYISGGFLFLLAFYLLALPTSWVIAMITAASIHELGHCAALTISRLPICSIEIGPLGARIVTGAMTPKQELFCALAGPAVGLLVCLLFPLFPKTACFALAQSLFNLLPFGPMDGGRAIRATGQLAQQKAVAKSPVCVYNDSD